MDIDFILNKIKLEQGIYSSSKIAELFNVSPSAVSNWRQRGKMPLALLQKYCVKYDFIINDYLNKKPIIKAKTVKIKNKRIKLETGKGKLMEAKYIIDLQKEKIERLEETIAKHKSTPIQSTVWDSLEYDYSVELSITFKNFKMGRTILKVNNINRICDVLGYSKQEVADFWDIGTLYTNFTKHPIDKILTRDTIKDIKSKVKALPTIFEALKDMLGNHYIPTPITYICKDKSFVHSISYNKVDWKNKIVKSKVQFLLNE